MGDTSSGETPPEATGLKGVVAGPSSISAVDGDAGILRYRGYSIDDLAAGSSFEETVYLLWNCDLPDRMQLADFTTYLASQREVPTSILDFLRRLPVDADAMGTLRTAMSALGQIDIDSEAMAFEANQRKAARITAQLATLAAAILRLRTGRDPVRPDPALGHAANFLFMARGERASADEVRAMDVALVLHQDHGFNASTFSAKVTAATLSDMHSAITSAIGTLKGPLHGGATRRVLEMLRDIGTPDHVPSWVDAKLAARERIMGFGHRVYKVEDPRAKHLLHWARRLAHVGDAAYLEIQERLVDVVHDRKKLHVNVDFYSAPLYAYLGLPPESYPMIFALSRVAGWTAHVMEQYGDNVLIRPRARYVGPGPRPYTDIESRPPSGRPSCFGPDG